MVTRRTLAALLGACALATTSEAGAESVPVELQFTTDSARTAGKAACDSKATPFKVISTFPNGTPAADPATRLVVYLTTARTCTLEPPTDSTVAFDQTIGAANATQTLSFGPSQIDAACPENTTKNGLICAVATQEGTGTTTGPVEVGKAQLTVTYDSQVPNKPVLTGAEGGNRALNISWTKQDDVSQWVVVLRKVDPVLPETDDDSCSQDVADAGAPADGGTAVGEERRETFEGDLGGGRVTDLVNNQVYEITLQAIDDADNASEVSDPIRGAPIKVDDFFTHYVCAGGDERGGFGCTSAGWALLPLASLALLPLLRRRSAGGRS